MRRFHIYRYDPERDAPPRMQAYDFEARDMIMRSGTHRRLTRSFTKFEKTWQRAGHWAHHDRLDDFLTDVRAFL